VLLNDVSVSLALRAALIYRSRAMATSSSMHVRRRDDRPLPPRIIALQERCKRLQNAASAGGWGESEIPKRCIRSRGAARATLASAGDTTTRLVKMFRVVPFRSTGTSDGHERGSFGNWSLVIGDSSFVIGQWSFVIGRFRLLTLVSQPLSRLSGRLYYIPARGLTHQPPRGFAERRSRAFLTAR
jgi:hypothetical protein